jgi:hypothetical protein
MSDQSCEGDVCTEAKAVSRKQPEMPDGVEKLLLELQLWTRQERGRVKELADAMDVKVQVASNLINLKKQCRFEQLHLR